MFDSISFKLLRHSHYKRLGYNLVRGSRVRLGHMEFKEITTKRGEKIRDKVTFAKLSSDSYDVNFRIATDQDFIKFEFSIPKYLYGHNLDHFPKTRGNEHYELYQFIKNFFLLEFKTVIEYQDIQLNRIDLCYNYFFETLENKQLYLEQLKDIMSNFFGENKVVTYSGDETFMYYTQDYSFKVYDKYKEFVKNDYKKIRKNQGKEYADNLALKAQNCLRVEMTFRQRKISYEFFNQINNSKICSNHFKSRFATLKRDFNNINSCLSRLSRTFNNALKKGDKNISCQKYEVDPLFKKYTNRNFDLYLTTLKYLIDTKEPVIKEYGITDFNLLLKKHYLDIIDEYTKLTSPKNVYFDINDVHLRWIRMYEPDVILFDEPLLNHLINKFSSLITDYNSFSLSNLTPLMSLHINRKFLTEQGFAVERLKKYVSIKQSFTKAQIIQKGIYKKSAYYENEKILSSANQILLDHKKSPLNSSTLPEKIVFV